MCGTGGVCIQMSESALSRTSFECSCYDGYASSTPNKYPKCDLRVSPFDDHLRQAAVTGRNFTGTPYGPGPLSLIGAGMIGAIMVFTLLAAGLFLWMFISRKNKSTPSIGCLSLVSTRFSHPAATSTMSSSHYSMSPVSVPDEDSPSHHSPSGFTHLHSTMSNITLGISRPANVRALPGSTLGNAPYEQQPSSAYLPLNPEETEVQCSKPCDSFWPTTARHNSVTPKPNHHAHFSKDTPIPMFGKRSQHFVYPKGNQTSDKPRNRNVAKLQSKALADYLDNVSIEQEKPDTPKPDHCCQMSLPQCPTKHVNVFEAGVTNLSDIPEEESSKQYE